MGASGPSATLAVTPHSVPTAGAARQLHVRTDTAYGIMTPPSACAVALHGHTEETLTSLLRTNQSQIGSTSYFQCT